MDWYIDRKLVFNFIRTDVSKDTFDKISDGKKTFAILKLLFEFSNKECPILIDQPEDSLDNSAIYNEFVT